MGRSSESWRIIMWGISTTTTGRGGTRRAASTTQGRRVWNNIILLLLFLFYLFCCCWVIAPCLGRELDDDAQVDVGENKCMEGERMALLAVRADIGGIDKWLSSWEREDDCCHWKGVGCDARSGHVVKLVLRHPYYSADYYGHPEDKSKVNPSLLNLTSLKYLDLSSNDFGGAQIPSFIGSLVHLEYLNLSHAGFVGTIPPQLGGLQNLRTLDLYVPSLIDSKLLLSAVSQPLLSNLKVENLGWLSHLTHLQYLDMSGVDLSAATDWFHVISMFLPSLSTLRLSQCQLPNLRPTSTLPHLNFTSLSTLDLSENYFNSTWPLWLFNVTSLTKLDLSYNPALHGPIPDGFGNMKHLEVLSFEYTGFEGVLPRSLWALDKLKLLHLSGGNIRIGLPDHMANLSNLQELELQKVNGRIPASLGNLNHLEYLSLSGGNITGGIPVSLGNLVNLKHLTLSNIPGNMPESLGNLSHLESLVVDGGNIAGGIPESLGRLANLQYLTLYDIHGKMPESLGNLSHLESLEVHGGNITGGIPESLGRLANLQYLMLFSMYGRIPESLGNLSHLKSLQVFGSNITGGIPESLGRLANLQYLRLDNVYGRMPESLGNLSHLESLMLDATGGIPVSLGNLANLKHLYFNLGNISRDLLRSMGHLCNLTQLSIYGNMARGAEVNELLEGLSQCTEGSGLETLDLRGNGIGGHLPDQVGQLKNLQSLVLIGTSIVGSIPASIGQLKSLTMLTLSYNKYLSGLVPSSVGQLSNVTNLDMSSNRFEGVLSEAHFANLSRLERLDMSSNPALSLNISWAWIPPFQISSFSMRGCSVGPEFPHWLHTQKALSQLQYLDLSRNNINDRIPLSICQIKSLKVLDLSYNYLTGEIPGCWEDSSLVALILSHNNLSGPIPSSPRMLPVLTSLHLDKNNLVGVIPPFLKYSTQLETLDLGENHLLGVIPTWLGESLSSLQVLRLRSNMFHGTIPTSLSQLQQLRILDLACNKLSGDLLLSFHNFSAMVRIEKTLGTLITYNIPAMAPINFEESIRIVPKGNELEYTKTLPLVTSIDLSNNNLSGQILEEITCLEGLRFLNLSRNHLEGRIPTSISRMVLLESLDLSFNHLSGNIPLNISTIHSLSWFNVSYNNMSGRIPSGSQLQTFDQSSYIGNPSLCGSPLLRPCLDDVIPKDPILQPSEEHADKHDPYKIWLYIGMGTGFAVGFWGFLGMLLAMEKKRVAYFRFIDYVADELYVMIVIHFARLKIKISSWMHG